MKKIALILALSCLTLLSNATGLLDETFNYSVTNLALETSWTTAGVLTTGAGRTILQSALNYSNGGKTYILSGVGKTLNSDISSATDYKSYKAFSATSINSGTVYLSFMYKAGVAQGQTNSEVMGLADGTNQGPRLWVGKGSINTSNYRFGLTRGITTGASVIWGSTEYSDVSQTFLVVIKYDFATTTASVFINPTLSTNSEPTTDIIDNTTATIRTQLNNLWFRCTGSSAAKFNIGGIKVAMTWAEVVADKNTPKLTSPVVGSATLITGDGFTANWSTVSSAQSYTVNVYQGATLAGTFNASGGSTSSLLISGLLPNTSYSYRVVAKGDGTNYGDSNESDSSSSFQTLDAGVVSILTNFGDGTWGATATSYTSGSYPTSSINGFNLVKAFLQSSSLTCVTGETHTNRILLDKSSQNAVIELPTLKTVGEVQIHAATGTDAMSFRLEEYVGSQWQAINTYTTRKTPDSIYVISFLRNAVTKLRIANNTGSGLYLYKILTLTYQQATDLTLRSSSPTEGEVCYSNLKKTITLTFNKNVSLASGTILLNGVSITLNTCTITDNTVTIPVALTTTAGSNKNYTLTVSAGSFAETGNLTNLSKLITVNFQALKSVAYPANYNGLIDVVYKNVNSTNCRMDIYYPNDAGNPVPVVINMHGGGWVSGAKEDQGGFNMYFNQGWAVANVEYRMRNEILAPAAVEDVRGAMQYLLNHADELHIDRNKIIFQGGSAGGHLALTGGYLQNNRIYDNDCQQYSGTIKVMAVIDKYGAADLMTFAPVYPGMVSWLGSRYSDDVFVKSLSPYEMIDTNTPPTYIIHGDADPTIPYTQSVLLQAKLQAAGVKNKFLTVPGGGHGGFPDAYNTQMETEVIAFLGEVINSQAISSVSQLNNSNINLNLSGNNLSIISNEKTLTSVFDCMGKMLVQTQEKTIKLNQSGLFIVKVKTTMSESNFKVIIK